MSLNVNDEKRELRSNSLTAEEEANPPSYSVEAPRQEAPEDSSSTLAQLDLRSPVKVSTISLVDSFSCSATRCFPLHTK